MKDENAIIMILNVDGSNLVSLGDHGAVHGLKMCAEIISKMLNKGQVSLECK